MLGRAFRSAAFWLHRRCRVPIWRDGAKIVRRDEERSAGMAVAPFALIATGQSPEWSWRATSEMLSTGRSEMRSTRVGATVKVDAMP
jgi:hypothetical protein